MPERERIKIDKKREMRTKEISKMINEGGLGADQYYEIEKCHDDSKNNQEDKEPK